MCRDYATCLCHVCELLLLLLLSAAYILYMCTLRQASAGHQCVHVEPCAHVQTCLSACLPCCRAGLGSNPPCVEHSPQMTQDSSLCNMESMYGAGTYPGTGAQRLHACRPPLFESPRPLSAPCPVSPCSSQSQGTAWPGLLPQPLPPLVPIPSPVPPL